MSDKIDITISIPSDAQSRAHTPYMMHDKFVDYCKANHVDINAAALEAYEKNGLLSPCIRVLYPRELLRRSFRANHLDREYEYKIRDEWKLLTELDNSVANSSHWINDGAILNIEKGHPLERALSEQNPYVIDPSKDKFRAWKRFKILEGELDGHKFYKSRADNYYAPWKIFQVDDLHVLNTDEHNRATGWSRGWGLIKKRLRSSSLNEFHPYFSIVTSFAYRRYLIRVRSFYPEQITINHEDVVKRYKTAAKDAFKIFSYEQWIRFLRKLIELYETSKEQEKYLLSEEAKSFTARTVHLVKAATNRNFHKICTDVTGKFKKYMMKGIEDEVLVYPGSLEEMFPDEKWDLEQNVKDLIVHEQKRFNASLSEGERLPEIISEQLFNELAKEPEGTSLAAVRKLDKAYSDPGLWYDTEIWSGIRDLAISIEVHGKEWLGGKKLDAVFRCLFSSPAHNYDSLKKMAGIDKFTDANDTKEFLTKLALVESLKQIPTDRRCGRHLLIAHLTRNYASHQKGLTGENLRENLSKIYSALIGTLLVLYAGYKKQ